MPREDVSHHPNRQQTWVQSLPCDWHRHRPFVHQVLLWVEEVRGNIGGAPTWGLRRRCQGRGRGRYSRGEFGTEQDPPVQPATTRWAVLSEDDIDHIAENRHSKHTATQTKWAAKVCFAIAKHGAGTGWKVSGLVISTSFPLFKKNGRLDIHIESRVVSREIYVCLYWFIRWRYVNAEKYVYSSVWLIR